MKKSEIRVGGLYLAKVGGSLRTVRVDNIRVEGTGRDGGFYDYAGRYQGEKSVYDVTNLTTGRKVTFRSAAKFRCEVKDKPCPQCKQHVPVGEDHPFGMHADCYARSGAARLDAGIKATPTDFVAVPKADPFGVEDTEGEQGSDPTPALPAAATASPSGGSDASTGSAAGTAVSSSPAAPAVAPTTALSTGLTPPESGLSTTGPTADSVEGEQGSDPTPAPSVAVPPAGESPSATGSPRSAATAASFTKEGEFCTGEEPDCCEGDIGSGADGVCVGCGKVIPPSPPQSSFAARLAASRQQATARRTGTGRARGTPVAGMVPNDEQEEILEVAPGLFESCEPGRALVVCAGAGTGKTATLKMIEQVLRGNGQYTAFNASLVNESRAKFKKAACNTTHSLAFRSVGRRYAHRLNGARKRSGEIAKILGIQDITVTLKGGGPPLDPGSDAWKDAAREAGYTDDNPPPGDFAPVEDRRKHLKASFLAGQVLAAVRRFCQSADPEIGPTHFGYIDGIDDHVEYADGSGKGRGYENNGKVRDYLEPFARAAWADLRSTEGQLTFSHDVYVKLWQLGTGPDAPVIAADYILLDEYQDTAPVFLDVLMRQQHALLVLVGDDNQRIYEWRGAVNAGDYFPHAPRRMLSQSYRFGQAVADVANTVLAELSEPTELVMRGNPAVPSRVAAVANPKCFLYRTNAGAVGRIMDGIDEGKRPHLVGGGAEVVNFCKAALDLQARRPTGHPELACFESWVEVQEYVRTDEGADLKLMVSLIDKFGAAKIASALENMPSEDAADFVVCTAHKSKGREWTTVRLGHDFPTANKMEDSDVRLLYVAATRARHTLDVTECPPFCGGYDTPDGRPSTSGEDRWVPGLKINFTQEQPTEEEQQAILGDKAPQPTPAPVAPQQPRRPAQQAQSRANDNNPAQFTWANIDGKWTVRGPANQRPGTRVTVTRKNGTTSVETIRSVVKQLGDLWFYGV